MTYFVITLLLLPWQLNGVSLCGVFLFIIRQHRLWLKSERRQKNWPPTNKITFTCISTWLYFPFYSFFLYNFSKISCHLQLPLLFSVSIHKLTSFMMQQQTSRWWASNPIFSSHPLQLSPSPQISGEHAGQLRTRSCLQLPSSLSTSLQNFCSLSLSAWPFVSSVDLVMISVTDQSPLAEIWGHSGSWECCTEEFDVCTAICNGSSPLVGLSMCCIYLSTGLAVIQSTGLSISVRQFVYLVHE